MLAGFNGLLKSVQFTMPFEDSVHLLIEQKAREEGIQAAYEEIVNQLDILGPANFQKPVHMANRYTFLNQYDKAMDLLELGFEMHDSNMPYIACGYGDSEPLYDDPRFIALMEKLHLPFPKD